MKRASIVVLGLLVAGFFAVHSQGVSAQEDFTALFDGSDLDAFNPIGDANWEIVGDVVQADSGSGFLVTKESYADFHLTLDFWVDEPANSGIFVRCADATSVNDRNSYEVNIYDTRADQTYRTGGIVHIAAPSSVVMTGGRWNSYDIRVEGSRDPGHAERASHGGRRGYAVRRRPHRPAVRSRRREVPQRPRPGAVGAPADYRLPGHGGACAPPCPVDRSRRHAGCARADSTPLRATRNRVNRRIRSATIRLASGNDSTRTGAAGQEGER